MESGWDLVTLPLSCSWGIPWNPLPDSQLSSDPVLVLYSHAYQRAWFLNTPGLELQGTPLPRYSYQATAFFLSVGPLISKAVSSSISESQFPHLYNRDNYSASPGLLKEVKQANVYKAFNAAVPGIRNLSVNAGNYYCYYCSWNTHAEKALRDHLN